MHNFILRFETVPTQKSTRAKPQKEHIVYQHFLSKDDEQLDKKDFKIFLVDNNEGFVAPARNISIAELHSEVAFCTELLKDVQSSCKEILNMSPPSSQLHSAFLMAQKHIRAAFSLGQSADCAVGTADVTVCDIGPGVSFPPGVKPKKFKSRHLPTSTQSSANPFVPTGLVANVSEPQDQGGVQEGQVPECAVDAPEPQDPDELAAIPEEELEGLEDVYDPQDESKVKPCQRIV